MLVCVPSPSPQQQFNSFLARYSPELQKEGRAALAAMQRLVPGAVRMVYDNYNFLVVGYGPSERASEAVLSLAFAPRWFSLCFLQDGASLPDPHRLLRGSGNVVRHVRLLSASELSAPAVRALITESLRRAAVPINPRGRGRMVIKSVSAKQRPRRPAAT
jgi:hypothetical protein